jgi:hypothetical protein
VRARLERREREELRWETLRRGRVVHCCEERRGREHGAAEALRGNRRGCRARDPGGRWCSGGSGIGCGHAAWEEWESRKWAVLHRRELVLARRAGWKREATRAFGRLRVRGPGAGEGAGRSGAV